VSFNGVAATFNIVSSSQIDATVPQGASTGALSVTTPAGTLTTATVFAVLTPATFTLTVNPPMAMVPQGQSATYTVKLDSHNGFSQLAALQVSDLPEGVNATLTPAQITAGQTALLKVTAASGQPTGEFSFSLSATATVLGVAARQSAHAMLSVQPVSTAF